MQSNPRRVVLPSNIRTERCYNISDRRYIGQRFKRNGGRKPRRFRRLSFSLALTRNLW